MNSSLDSVGAIVWIEPFAFCVNVCVSVDMILRLWMNETARKVDLIM